MSDKQKKPAIASKIYWSGLAALAVLVAGCGGTQTGTTSPETQMASEVQAGDMRPNILLVLVDDMGFTDIGSFGSEISTPNLDALAYSGVRFSNFHAMPTCTPTRGMLMTGLSSHGAGVGDMSFKRAFDNGAPVPESVQSRAGNSAYAGYLLDRVATLPEVLSDVGYRTYMTGKWDLGRALVEEHIPVNRGFDRAFALLTGTANHLGEPDENGRGMIPRGDFYVYRDDHEVVRELPADYYSTDFFVDKLIEYLDESSSSEQPFFAYLALTAPHWPLQTPEESRDQFVGKYEFGFEELAALRRQRALEEGVISGVLAENPAPLADRAWSELSDEERAVSIREMELYAAMVSDLDAATGRLIGFLQDAGELDNTLVVFLSDNGASPDREPLSTYLESGWQNDFDALGAWNTFPVLDSEWSSASMAGLRDLKGSGYEGGTRVAAFVAGASVLAEGGTVVDNRLTAMDVMPTLMEVAQVNGLQNFPDAPELTGRSFAPLMRGEEALIYAPEDDRAFEFGNFHWIVRGDWKAISESDGAEWQLYDLASDPAEQQDLSALRPELLESMVSSWNQWAEETGVVD